MSFNIRKFFVWFVSLAVVIAVFLVYHRLSNTGQIETSRGLKTTEMITQADADNSSDKIGMVGDIGLGGVELAKFTELDPRTGRVTRQFGFEKLLHKDGQNWETRDPFMNIYKADFNCRITADKGIIQVETALGKISPTDATFSENVVIHILPQPANETKDSFIYLDDITYIAEKSHFSTNGPVRFVSEDARMSGRGLEFVYNEQLERIEFLRINHLDNLKLRLESDEPVSSTEKKEQKKDTIRNDSKEPIISSRPDTAAVTSDKQKPSPAPLPATNKQKSPQDTTYRCIFSENVVIDSAENVVFADEFHVVDISGLKRSASKSPRDTSGSNSKNGVELDGVYEKNTVSKEEKTYTAEQADKEPDVVPVKSSEPDVLNNKRSSGVVITCDSGILVAPMDSCEPYEMFIADKTEKVHEVRAFERFEDTELNGRSVFAAGRVDYNYLTGNVTAAGPSRLGFILPGLTAEQGSAPLNRVIINAAEKAEFLPDSNRIIFEGDTRSTMTSQKAGILQQHILSAPKLTVYLSEAKADIRNTGSSPVAAGDIEHLTADGGLVRLESVKKSDEQSLGGSKLKCYSLNYNNSEQLLVAGGPGTIAVDNSQIANPKIDTGRFSLQKPCYAVIRNFATLNYFLNEDRITADAGADTIFIDYFPIVNNKYDRQISATAKRIKALLRKTGKTNSELTSLLASGGITYQDQDRQFAGSRLFYDAEKSLITVKGQPFNPCYFNGAAVDGIEFDLKTDRVKTEIASPGAL